MMYGVRAHRAGCAVEVFTVENEVENVIGVYRTPREQVDDVVKYFNYIPSAIQSILFDQYGMEFTNIRYEYEYEDMDNEEHHLYFISENIFDEMSTLKFKYSIKIGKYSSYDVLDISYERAIHHEIRECGRGIKYSTNFDRNTCGITEKWESHIHLGDTSDKEIHWTDKINLRDSINTIVWKLINIDDYED